MFRIQFSSHRHHLRHLVMSKCLRPSISKNQKCESLKKPKPCPLNLNLRFKESPLHFYLPRNWINLWPPSGHETESRLMPRLVKVSIVIGIIYQCSITKLWKKNLFNLSTPCPRPPPRRSRLATTLPHSLHSSNSYNCRPLFKANLHPAMISEPMAQTRSKHRCQTNLKLYIAI